MARLSWFPNGILKELPNFVLGNLDDSTYSLYTSLRPNCLRPHWLIFLSIPPDRERTWP